MSELPLLHLYPLPEAPSIAQHPRDRKGACRSPPSSNHGSGFPILSFQYMIFSPSLSPASTTMNPTFAVAPRESETLQRAGTTATIFVISLFGASHPTPWLPSVMLGYG